MVPVEQRSDTAALVKAFELEQERIREFSQTALGQLTGCPGFCVLCDEKSHSCEMNVKLREIEDKLFSKSTTYYLDGLNTRYVL